MSYYARHIFFCLNQREKGEACCADHDAEGAFAHCKSRVKAAKLNGPGKVRVNRAGCLDRCAGGMIPLAVSRAWAEKAIDLVEWLDSQGTDLRLGRSGGPEHMMFPGSEAIDVYRRDHKDPLLKRNRRAFVGNNGLRTVDHSLQHAVEIQS